MNRVDNPFSSIGLFLGVDLSSGLAKRRFIMSEEDPVLDMISIYLSSFS